MKIRRKNKEMKIDKTLDTVERYNLLNMDIEISIRRELYRRIR